MTCHCLQELRFQRTFGIFVIAIFCRLQTSKKAVLKQRAEKIERTKRQISKSFSETFQDFLNLNILTLNGVLFLHSKRRKLCSLMKEHSDAFAGLAERKHTFVNVQHEERL